MLALVAAVFLASVLGSLHCVGMCGAFLALAFNDTPKDERWKVTAAYHVGRLATYVLLGIIGGALGSLLNMAGGLAGIQRVALPLAGGTVIVFALVTILQQQGFSVRRLRLPRRWVQAVGRLQQVAMRLSPTRRAWTIGLLTTLLPCGWLYAFAATAAGTGDPLRGGVVMAVFWAGTLPAMAVVGVGFQSLAGSLGKRLPIATCVILMGFGGWAIAGRSQIDVPRLASAASEMDVTQPASSSALPCHTTPSLDPATGLVVENPESLCGHSAAQIEGAP